MKVRVLENKNYNVQVSKASLEWYKNHNIECKIGSKITVKGEIIFPRANILVWFMCDYCDNCFQRKPQALHRYLEKSKENNKVACDNCRVIKRRETSMIRYGVDNPNKLEKFQEKAQDTLELKYGVRHPLQSEELYSKMIDTNLKKYGTENVFQNRDIIEKCKATSLEKYNETSYTKTDEYLERKRKTCLDRYGVDSYSKTEEFSKKFKETCLSKYGYTHYNKSPILKAKIKETHYSKYNGRYFMQTKEGRMKQIKGNMKKYNVPYVMQNKDVAHRNMLSRFKNGNIISSNQQTYINKLYNGVLNYVVGNCALDIALIDENIYCEYDGGFHSGQVILGILTEDEFKTKEIKRYYFLKNKGWKNMRIISNRDNIPSDDKLIEMLHISIEYLSKGHSFIGFNIDEGTVAYSKNIRDYNYGELRKISNSDIRDLES